MFKDTSFCPSTVYGYVFTRVHPSIELIVFFFFNDFLSDSVEITSCEYTETIIQLS